MDIIISKRQVNQKGLQIMNISSRKIKFKAGQYLRHGILCIVGLFTVFPFLWMILGSLKTKTEVIGSNSLLPAVLQWENYVEIITDSPIPRYIGNSLFVALAIVTLQIITGTLLAYGLTFFVFRGRDTIFSILMATYMLPTAVTYIPCYIILANANLLNTHEGLILSNAINIFGIFLLRQAFRQIPDELVDAAKIDGAGNFCILLHIIIPMTKSTFITFILISFIGSYNSYMWPSLITDSPELSLVSQGLRRFLFEGGAYGTQWQLVMAAGTIVVVPLLILFLCSQKWIMQGITDTGSKG